MTGGEWGSLLGAIATNLAVIGVGIRWLITRMDRKAEKETARRDVAVQAREKEQDRLRSELRDYLEKRITELAAIVTDQQRTIKQQEHMIEDYVAHVNQLERIMAAGGLTIPDMIVRFPQEPRS